MTAPRQPRARRGLRGWIGRLYLWAGRWELVGTPPDIPQFVLIAAPHTSGWDLPVMLAVAMTYGVRLAWVGKAELFRGPLGRFLLAMGGIPIDRSCRHNTVQLMVERFKTQERLYLAIAPEGTRGRREHWRSGFYHIALGAGVPLVLGFIDFKRKQTGVGPALMLTGDMEADMRIIRAFYEPINALHPALKGPIVLADEGQTGAGQAQTTNDR